MFKISIIFKIFSHKIWTRILHGFQVLEMCDNNGNWNITTLTFGWKLNLPMFWQFFSNITKNNVFMLKNKSTNELSVELHVENVLIINKKKIWYKIFTFNSQHMYFFVNLRKDITDCNVTVSLAVILVITFQVFTLYYVSDT